MSDYATYPFDFHKLFTLQKLWQWLLSCAKAFTYVVCLRNAAPVIAIILKKKKKERKNTTRLHEGCHFQFSFVVCIFFALRIKHSGVISLQKQDVNKSSDDFYIHQAIKQSNCTGTFQLF